MYKTETCVSMFKYTETHILIKYICLWICICKQEKNVWMKNTLYLLVFIITDTVLILRNDDEKGNDM